MNGKVYVGQKALSLTEYDKSAPITGVILWVDDENCYQAGDQTGTVIEQDCPYASQEMANSLLATLQGYSYQGLEANGAKVSPIAELGDGLTVDGLYTQLAYQNIRFSTGEVMDVAAPGSDETLHEYKTEGQTTKQFTHQIAETKSLISKTSEEITLLIDNEIQGLSSQFTVQLGQIRAELTNEINGLSASVDLKFDGLEASFEDEINGLSADFDVKLNGLQANFEDEINGLSSTLNVKIDGIEASLEDEINGLSSSINLQIDSITSTVQGLDGQVSTIQQTVGSITTQITGINGDISSLEQTATSLQTQIRNAQGDISTIEQYVDSITLSVTNGSTSSTIQLKAGGTTIASQNITMSGLVTFTGLANGTTTINGACIKTGTIDADRLNLTGAIAFSDLQSTLGSQIQNTANTVSGWTYSGSTYIDGTKIQTGTVTASILQGGQIQLLTESGIAVGFLGLTAAQTAGSAISISSVGGLRFLANSGDVFVQNGTSQYIQLISQKQTTDIQTVVVGNGNLITNKPNVYLLGLPAQPWKSAYLAEPASIWSDANTKNSIDYNIDKYDAFFDLLKPAAYRYNHGTSGRYHTGFIAQDVESAISAVGLRSEDFAGFTKDKETGKYSLRYEEFIPLCVEQIQNLKKRIADLEELK